MATHLLSADAVVLDHAVAIGAKLAIEDGRVLTVDLAASDGPTTSGTLLPGFVDLQVNGAAGRSVAEATPEALETIARQVGVGGAAAFLPTVITAPFDDMLTQIRAVAAWIAERAPGPGAAPLGIHVEGPFLANAGAHDAAALLDPTPARVDAILEAGAGRIRLVTLAPSRDGAAEAVARFRDAGVAVALGHGTGEAGIADCIAAGATLATHLFNAMGAFDHRDPGMAGRLMDATPLSCSLILDRVHVHDVAVRLAHRAIGVERMLLVTDCVAAMGMPDGEYRLGAATVFRQGESVRDAAGNLAGSTVDMFGAARNFLDVVPGTGPWSLARVASRNPARLIGAEGYGAIAPGAVACFAVLRTDGSLETLDLRNP